MRSRDKGRFKVSESGGEVLHFRVWVVLIAMELEMAWGVFASRSTFGVTFELRMKLDSNEPHYNTSTSV